MALDPTAAAVLGASADPLARLTARVRDLERQVEGLGRIPTIQVSAGAPSGPAREGTPAGQSSPTRLWLYVGGGWHFTALT